LLVHRANEAPVSDINQVITDMMEMIQYSLKAEIAVTYELDPSIWKTSFIAGEFQDVLLNLVINSRDAILEQGSIVVKTENAHLDAPLTFRTKTIPADDYIKLSVIDDGEGMSEAAQKRIFEPFYTTKELGKGTGLGMSLVFGFVERAGGYILVNSEIGEGTSVSIYLPKVTDSDEAVSASSSGSAEILSVCKTILLVDDELELLQLTKANLEACGFNVLAAESAEAALEIIRSHPEIDLLFSDVVMPGGLNGFELADKAKQLLPGIKVLHASGFAGELLEDGIYEEYCQNLIQKPYSCDAVVDDIGRVFGHAGSSA